jgi:hypothetical protein
VTVPVSAIKSQTHSMTSSVSKSVTFNDTPEYGFVEPVGVPSPAAVSQCDHTGFVSHVPAAPAYKGLPLAKLKYQNRSSPPFNPGGRGSKQLSKAIEQSKVYNHQYSHQIDAEFVLCTGTPPCFAKVISAPSTDINSTIIQPMYPSPHDTGLLMPWDGHLWVAKSQKLIPINVSFSDWNLA